MQVQFGCRCYASGLGKDSEIRHVFDEYGYGVFLRGGAIKHLTLSQPVKNDAAMQPADVALKLAVRGFTQSERQMLDAIVKLSQRRQPRLELLGAGYEEDADVVMIDGTDAQAMKWAGMRLWLKRKVVIWVDTPNAQGGTSVTRPIQWPSLPMILARAMEKNHGPAAVDTALKSGPVLVVDDSIAIRAQLRSQLEQRGLEVTEAASAEVAIKATAASSYCIVLMDVIMPGIDGYEACRLIKAQSNKQTVVMLTSRSSPFDRIRGKMAGCDAYLTKPIDSGKLHEVISRYIAKPAGRDAQAQSSATPYANIVNLTA
jgi:twitching motility two-component system response regulator PilG